MKRDFEIFFDEEIKELGKVNLPDPSLLGYYMGLQQRELYLNDYVDDALVDMGLQILKWNKDDKNVPIEQRKPIKIFINSDGGDLIAVMSVIDIILASKTKVITVGLGKCFSSGGLLLMSGHERFIFPNTQALIHDGSCGAMGNTGKVMDTFEYTQKQEKRVKDYILKQTKINEKLYNKNYRKDWFLFSDEIIELGVAHKIVTDLDEVI